MFPLSRIFFTIECVRFAIIKKKKVFEAFVCFLFDIVAMTSLWARLWQYLNLISWPITLSSYTFFSFFPINYTFLFRTMSNSACTKYSYQYSSYDIYSTMICATNEGAFKFSLSVLRSAYVWIWVHAIMYVQFRSKIRILFLFPVFDVYGLIWA